MNGIETISAERERQSKKWNQSHDDSHDNGEMLAAATVYLDPHWFTPNHPMRQSAWWMWPWERSSMKRDSCISDLAKAGALIAAEIDRIQRLPIYTEDDFPSIGREAKG